MNKLELAHEYAKVLLQQPVTRTIGEVVSISFGLAEEMLAENEKREDKSRPEALDEWQPDWSQAPDGANWWAMDFDGSANWFSYKPYISSEYPNEWIYNGRNHGGLGIEYWRAMPFDYKGGWQDSLRKRP